MGPQEKKVSLVKNLFANLSRWGVILKCVVKPWCESTHVVHIVNLPHVWVYKNLNKLNEEYGEQGIKRHNDE